MVFARSYSGLDESSSDDDYDNEGRFYPTLSKSCLQANLRKVNQTVRTFSHPSANTLK